MTQRKELQQLLAEKRLKKTSQRALIWASLLESKGHPSVEEIRDNLLKQGHRIGLATIYRTIKLLLQSGFIRQSKLHGMTRYEPVVHQPNHLHFICNSCGSTVEFPSRRIENLIRRATEAEEFEERYSRYAVFGICKICQRQNHVPAARRGGIRPPAQTSSRAPVASREKRMAQEGAGTAASQPEDCG